MLEDTSLEIRRLEVKIKDHDEAIQMLTEVFCKHNDVITASQNAILQIQLANKGLTITIEQDNCADRLCALETLMESQVKEAQSLRNLVQNFIALDVIYMVSSATILLLILR